MGSAHSLEPMDVEKSIGLRWDPDLIQLDYSGNGRVRGRVPTGFEVEGLGSGQGPGLRPGRGLPCGSPA